MAEGSGIRHPSDADETIMAIGALFPQAVLRGGLSAPTVYFRKTRECTEHPEARFMSCSSRASGPAGAPRKHTI